MSLTLRLRTAAAASLLAMAVLGAPMGQVHAATNGGGSTPTGQKTCTDPDGRQVAAGTVWTSTTQNGQTIKYKCNGATGQWDLVTGPPRPSMDPRVPTTGGKKAAY